MQVRKNVNNPNNFINTIDIDIDHIMYKIMMKIHFLYEYFIIVQEKNIPNIPKITTSDLMVPYFTENTYL